MSVSVSLSMSYSPLLGWGWSASLCRLAYYLLYSSNPTQPPSTASPQQTVTLRDTYIVLQHLIRETVSVLTEQSSDVCSENPTVESSPPQSLFESWVSDTEQPLSGAIRPDTLLALAEEEEAMTAIYGEAFRCVREGITACTFVYEYHLMIYLQLC